MRNPFARLIPGRRTILVAAAAALLIGASATAGAFAGIRLRARPTMSFKPGYDFGKVMQGKIVEHTFAFKNTGTKALVVNDLKTSCGCTAALVGTEKPPVRIEPGRSSDIKVTLKTAGKVGRVTKTVTVLTNDVGEGNRMIDIDATVQLPPGAASHPEFAGAQEILKGDCAGCHVSPGRGKTGAALYKAACAMCHGDKGQGAGAAALNQLNVTMRDDVSLTETIAKGIQTGGMPGFQKGAVENGPYDKAQVDSLVRFIKSWPKIVPKSS